MVNSVLIHKCAFSSFLFLKNQFVPNGALKDLPGYQNSRFGSCIASVPDLNQDSYSDVVVGAPLEDEHQGALYIFHGYRENLIRRYKQVQILCRLWDKGREGVMVGVYIGFWA